MCHYVSDESCEYFSLKMQQNAFGDQALPGPTGRSYSAPDLLAGFKG